MSRVWTRDDFPPSRVPRRRFSGRPPNRSWPELIELWKTEAAEAKKLRGFDADVRLKLLDAGMRAWMERAHQKWLEQGGGGLATVEQAREIVAAGYPLHPLSRPEVVASAGASLASPANPSPGDAPSRARHRTSRRAAADGSSTLASPAAPADHRGERPGELPGPGTQTSLLLPARASAASGSESAGAGRGKPSAGRRKPSSPVRARAKASPRTRSRR